MGCSGGYSLSQWLKHRTESWVNGRGFESVLPHWERRLSVLTLISGIHWFTEWVHPRVTALAARKILVSHSAKSAGGRLQLNTHTPYVCGFAWSGMVYGCMVYTVGTCTETEAVSCHSGTSHAGQRCKYCDTTSMDIQQTRTRYKKLVTHAQVFIVQELCESRGGRPGLSVLTSLLVSVDVKNYWTVLRHWSQLVPNMLNDIWGH